MPVDTSEDRVVQHFIDYPKSSRSDRLGSPLFPTLIGSINALHVVHIQDPRLQEWHLTFGKEAATHQPLVAAMQILRDRRSSSRKLDGFKCRNDFAIADVTWNLV